MLNLKAHITGLALTRCNVIIMCNRGSTGHSAKHDPEFVGKHGKFQKWRKEEEKWRKRREEKRRKEKRRQKEEKQRIQA
jgi:hypothetical protein